MDFEELNYYIVCIRSECNVPRSYNTFYQKLVAAKTKDEAERFGKSLLKVHYTERDMYDDTNYIPCSCDGDNLGEGLDEDCEYCYGEYCSAILVHSNEDVKVQLEKQKQYYENLLKEKLQEQKEQLLEEIYSPPDTIGSNDSPYSELRGIGYSAAKERFET